MFLLIFFCQGRADYYFVPVFLLISQSNSIVELLNTKVISNMLRFSIILQSILLIIFNFISISQNIKSFHNYQSNLRKISYGYNESQYIYKEEDYFTLITGRNTRFYYKGNYIDKDLFENCLILNSSNNQKSRQEYCLKKYKIFRIISSTAYDNEWKLSKENFNCKTEDGIYGGRNPLNRRKIKIEICDKN